MNRNTGEQVTRKRLRADISAEDIERALTVGTAVAPSSLRHTDDPNDSFTHGMTPAQAKIRRQRDARELRRLLLVGLIVGIIVVVVGAVALVRVVRTQQAVYGQSQYTGWAGTDANGNPTSLTLEPCQHSPCPNVSVDLTLREATRTDPNFQHHYVLGGYFLNDRELYVAGTYESIILTADITCSQPIDGSITAGTAVMTLKRGSVVTIFQLKAATLQEQSEIFAQT